MIELTEDQVLGLIKAIEEPSEMQTMITLMWLRSILKGEGDE
jgi:hypothetical protein